MNSFRASLASVFLFSLFAILPIRSHAANSLSLGADYMLRGVTASERDSTLPSHAYYDQRLIGYMTTDLSKDVEATIRIQSITPWGLEGSSNPLHTRYPNANGGLWVQNAFVRLPDIWDGRVSVTAGRQPIQWGDGFILSDDDLGFDAVRAHVVSPWRFLPVDLDGFTAKVSEGLEGSKNDSDLDGAVLGIDTERLRWEFMGLFEKSGAAQPYQMGAETEPVTSSDFQRIIYGVRAQTNLKDAFVRGEYYMQGGSFKRGTQKMTLGGSAYALGIGGRQNTERFGRFGAILEWAEGSGDEAKTTSTGEIDSGTKDEAFRPTFASRWSGLERKGFGHYMAATFSDIRSASDPFGPVDSTNTGLPPSSSGVQTLHFGMDSTPWSPVTLFIDYYQYKAVKHLEGNGDLGTEFDYGAEYRYSGLVTIRATTSAFTPGSGFDNPETPLQNTKRKGTLSSLELVCRF